MKNQHVTFQIPPRAPLCLLIITSVIAILVNSYAFYSGWQTIYQNIYYFPIIIACLFFLKRGFYYSLFLTGFYAGVILLSHPDSLILLGALIRVVIFILVAGTITLLATRQAKTARQLRESEERYRTLFNNAILGIYRTTPAGTYLDMNPAFAHMYGYDSPEEMMTSIHDIQRQLYVDPGDRQKIKELLATIGEVRGFETENLHRNGSTIWISINARAVRDESGEILWYEGTIEDITGRKRSEEELNTKNEDLQTAYEELAGSEEELRQNLNELTAIQTEVLHKEKKYRQLFETNVIGIALHEMIPDASGRACDYRILDLNQAYETMTGLNADDITGKTAAELFPERGTGWNRIFDEVARHGTVASFEDYHPGAGRYYDITAYSPEKGQVATLTLDVTSQKLSEISLAEANSYLENLLRNAFSPIIVWDPEFRITRVNHACELLVGRDSEALIGRSLEILFPKEEAARSMDLIRRTLEGVRWETVELMILHLDGSIKTVVWNSATIYHPETNTPIATIAQGRDVTRERLVDEEKRAASSQIQENIAQLAILNDGIRNPLTIIAVCAELTNDSELSGRISRAVREIDGMVRNLDQQWIRSEKILEFLRKHNHIESDFNKPNPVPVVQKNET